MTKYPCYGCTRRHYNCHSSCKKYSQMKTEMDERRKEEKYQRNADYHAGRVSRATTWS